MKRQLILHFVLLAMVKALSAQNCEYVNIATDSVKKRVLSDFHRESVQNHYFLPNKGVVELTVFTNKEGYLCWQLVPLIDDRFKANPPTQYSTFLAIYDEYVLIYKGNEYGNRLKTQGDTAAINRCLRGVLEDRVYINPTYSKRLKQITLPDGQKRTIEQRTHLHGNGGEVIIIFNKDGTIKEKIRPS